jgi:NAD(P)H-dependent flavin oxidoreductase YrpB (nitropropane dioxygenase family)
MAIALQTPLCHRLGIEVPIFNAGIGSGAGPELAAAVSNAGGFGVIGASANGVRSRLLQIASAPDAAAALRCAQVRCRRPSRSDSGPCRP